MADVNYDNIPSIIGIYEGTVASFEDIMNGTDTAKKQTFYGRLILITGDQTATDENAADRKQALWTSEDDGSNAHYLNMSDVATLKAQLAHIDGIAFPKDGGSSTSYDKYDLTGGKGFIFKGSNGITVKINPSTSTSIDGKPYWSIEVNGQTLKADLIGTTGNGSNTSAYPDTITGAKAYTDKVASDLKGAPIVGDSTTETIRGAKDYAAAAAAAAAARIVTNGQDVATDDTIRGAKLYTDAAIQDLLGEEGDAYTQDTIYGAKAYAETKDITIDSTNTDDTLAGKYVIKKNGVELATINIPKELVVTEDGSEIVKGTWSGDTFTESETGPDKALKLAIQNQTTPIYINVADLVNVYTAAQGDAAAEVQITISENNVISAVIKTGGISTDKIADKAVTKAKLGVNEQNALTLANTSIQGVSSGSTDYISVDSKNNGGVTDMFSKVITAKTAEITSETATADGLATVADIRAYLAARLSVKVVS